LRLLEKNRYNTSQLRSKNWDEFALPDAPVMDFVLTVCDKATGEVCPVWPGQPLSAHWGVADPVNAFGKAIDDEKPFVEALMVLTRRISLFTVLPCEKLDRLALQREVAAIGTAGAVQTS
jgi:arsenate reductase